MATYQGKHIDLIKRVGKNGRYYFWRNLPQNEAYRLMMKYGIQSFENGEMTLG